MRTESECMIDRAPDDSQMNGCTSAMSVPSAPRFGARRRSSCDPLVPM